MKRKPKITISMIFHLSEKYYDQYTERDLNLSPEQNEACFRDFVNQYYSALYWRKQINLVIDTNVPLF
jgi:hypothetical protein